LKNVWEAKSTMEVGVTQSPKQARIRERKSLGRKHFRPAPLLGEFDTLELAKANNGKLKLFLLKLFVE
jgi:hypothetical protein